MTRAVRLKPGMNSITLDGTVYYARVEYDPRLLPESVRVYFEYTENKVNKPKVKLGQPLPEKRG